MNLRQNSQDRRICCNGESGLLWYSLRAAVTALGVTVLTGKKCRKDEE
ncbi:MAG: hypothetical protein ACLS49_12325 [Christensenellales bacterium]